MKKEPPYKKGGSRFVNGKEMERDMKGIIFDLDGVICHTDQYHYTAWKQLADRLGIPFDQTMNNRLRGVSRSESLELLLQRSEVRYTPEEKRRLADEKNDCYVRLLGRMTPAELDPAVKRTLCKLRGRGLALAIGSSSRNAPLILRRLGLERFFDAVADGNQIQRSKPDPEVFLLAAKKLYLPPSECLVVEDAQPGVAAALAGGFAVAALGDARGAPGVNHRLTALEDLLKLA